jgi:hypothetical protein
MHPSFSNAAASTPSTLNTTYGTNPNHASPFESNWTGVSARAPTYPDVSSGAGSNIDSANLFARSDIHPTYAQSPTHTSSYGNDWGRQYGPQSPNQPSQQMPLSGQNLFNGFPDDVPHEVEESTLGLSRSQQRAIKKTKKSKPPTKGPQSMPSEGAYHNATDLALIDPRLIQADASSPRRRSPSASSSEATDSTDEDG